MALLSLRDIHLSYGDPPLLDGLSFVVEAGQRICLMGRNGEGKSTLLRVISGEIAADDGERVVRDGIRIARLTQEVPQDVSGRVFDLVADGLGDIAELVKAYHAASGRVQQDAGGAAMQALADAQHALEAADGWSVEQQVETVLSRMDLDADAEVAALSGGMKRRVLLARALVGEPDLLLLDEPTNHLDIDAIAWLEEFLLAWQGTLIFITHDRGFLRRIATRLLELDRGQVADFPGDYANYLRRREEMDNAEAQANARFDKMLAQEETWIRQGIKARRTRNEGRVRRLQAMREDYGARRGRQGSAKLVTNSGESSGKLVCEAVDVSYAWDGRPIVRGLTKTIQRGDRIGIIGPNGCGKTTLLRLLLGDLEPDSGSVRLGTRLQVAYFDQMRAQLDLDRSVLDNVADGSDKVEINGRSKHVISYLQDFLFPPQRCRQPVGALSGGERNRLLLARLFTRPANVLVLDEPTNDLDLETLELLEELLLEFEGTLLLVSHDREFIDNVVTSTLVFEGDGRVNDYVGGYGDWLRQRAAGRPAAATRKATPGQAVKPSRKAPAKLGYKDQRELEQLPQRIEELETTLEQIQARLGDPAVYRDQPDEIAGLQRRMTKCEQTLAMSYARWEALEEKKSAGA